MRTKILKIYFWLAVVAAAYGLWLWITGIGIPCYYLSVRGYQCPGCGLSRMVLSLAKLQFGNAFSYNPVGFVAFFAWNTVAALCYWGKPQWVTRTAFLCLLLAATMTAFLIQGLLRNLA